MSLLYSTVSLISPSNCFRTLAGSQHKRRVDFCRMTLRDWNPLSHFRELIAFPKTVFLIGFIFLGVGITRGLSPYNRTVILAFAMIAFSLTVHYLSQSSYPVTI